MSLSLFSWGSPIIRMAPSLNVGSLEQCKMFFTIVNYKYKEHRNTHTHTHTIDNIENSNIYTFKVQVKGNSQYRCKAYVL